MPVALPKTASIAEAQAAGANGAIPLDDLPNDYTPLWQRGCQLWLAADRITGLADASPVTTWSDLSGNGRDATQATAGAKPTFKPGIIGGKPVVRFDGIDDYLATAAFDVGASTITTVVLLRPTNIGVDTQIFGLGGSFRLTVTVDSTMFRAFVNALGPVGGSTPLSNNVATIRSFTLDLAGNIAYRVNGIPDSSRVLTPQDLTGNGILYIGTLTGSSQFLPGDIAELIIYNRVLGISEILTVTRYLGRKYSIAGVPA